RQHAVVRPQRVVVAQVDLDAELGPRLVARHLDPLDPEPERGRVELELGVRQRLAHHGGVAVGAGGGQLVVVGLPAHQEVAHRVVRRRLLQAAGQRRARDRQRDGRGERAADSAHRVRWRSARAISRLACFSASACRLSQSFLPRATAISILALPSLKYSWSGTIVSPPSLTLAASLSISLRWSSSLRLRRAAWLVQVPCAYSGMWTLISHASPPSMLA